MVSALSEPPVVQQQETASCSDCYDCVCLCYVVESLYQDWLRWGRGGARLLVRYIGRTFPAIII